VWTAFLHWIGMRRPTAQWHLQSVQSLARLDSPSLLTVPAVKEVPLYEAKNGLSALIAEVESTGESVIITRHGKPAACLTAIVAGDRSLARQAIARLLIEQLEREDAQATGPDWTELKSEMDAERP